ncbi:hypothetical protein E2C01_059208 [Portunus trituberculatus]|uniref:Uncharacterized protein n=1 Tax=Portunus trituberculatus TaxID=210409 RepID=A0A5B7GXF5_PORTR|nr:hypothetical protein [Portunus trituberculatus]
MLRTGLPNDTITLPIMFLGHPRDTKVKETRNIPA